MAQVQQLPVVERLPIGNKFLSVFWFLPSTIGGAADWVRSGFQSVDAAAIQPTGATPAYSSLQLNARGTGVAEGTDPGDVGVELTATSWSLLFVIGV